MGGLPISDLCYFKEDFFLKGHAPPSASLGIYHLGTLEWATVIFKSSSVTPPAPGERGQALASGVMEKVKFKWSSSEEIMKGRPPGLAYGFKVGYERKGISFLGFS